MVHGAASTVTRLEAGLVLAGIGRLILVLGLVTPIAFEVTGAGSVVASTALELIVNGEVGGTATASTTAIDGHALTAAVATTSTTVRRLGGGSIDIGLSSWFGRLIRLLGRGCRERKAARSSLLLGDFGGLLSVSQSQRVTSLMTSTSAATTATSATCILASGTAGSFEVAEA